MGPLVPSSLVLTVNATLAIRCPCLFVQRREPTLDRLSRVCVRRLPHLGNFKIALAAGAKPSQDMAIATHLPLVLNTISSLSLSFLSPSPSPSPWPWRERSSGVETRVLRTCLVARERGDGFLYIDMREKKRKEKKRKRSVFFCTGEWVLSLPFIIYFQCLHLFSSKLRRLAHPTLWDRQTTFRVLAALVQGLDSPAR